MTNGHGETSIPLQLVVVVGGGIRTQIVNEELLSCAKDAKTERLRRGSVALLRASNGPISFNVQLITFSTHDMCFFTLPGGGGGVCDLFLSCSELYFPHVLTINVDIF